MLNKVMLSKRLCFLLFKSFRGRLKKLELKFSQIPSNMSVNAALKLIRQKQRAENEKHRAEKKPEMYQKWYALPQI